MADLVQMTVRAEEAEAAVLTELMAAARPAVAERLGLALVIDRGAVASLVAAVDALSLNRVVGLGVSAPATEAQLDRILEFARASGVSRLLLQVAPTAAPEGLPSWLAARGAQRHNRWIRFWRRVDAPLPVSPTTDLRLAEVGPADAEGFARVVREAFGMPPSVDEWIAASVGRAGWSHYGAWDGGDLVATGAVCATNHTAWFGLAATKASHRGHGAQGALIARRYHRAAALGCEWVITETAEELPDRPAPSYRNMVRLGFTEAYRRQNYAIALADSGLNGRGHE